MARESVKAYDNLLILKGGAESVVIRLVQGKDGQPLFLVKVTRPIYNGDTHRFFYEDVGSPKWIGGGDADRMEEWLTAKFREFREIAEQNSVADAHAESQADNTHAETQTASPNGGNPT